MGWVHQNEPNPSGSRHDNVRVVSALERIVISHMAAGDPKHPTPFPFEALTDDEFDDLVYLLAHAADPEVAKVRAPDGGLDTVRLSAGDPLVAAWGIQAKLHRGHIKWPDCKQSLDRAVAVWQARAVTFAFPCDLTQGQHKLFHKHLGARHPGVALDWWGQSKLTAMLLASPAGRGIAKRFFHSEDPADLADRAIRAGGPLRTAADLLERETATDDFLQSADPHFGWISTKSPRGTPPAPPQPGTALRLQFSRNDQQLVVDALPRPGALPPGVGPRGALVFPDESGREEAIKLLHAVGTLGGRAELGRVSLRIDQVPAPFDDLLTEPIEGLVTVRAHREVPAWAATVAVDTDEGTATLDFDLATEEPGDEWDARLVGARHGLTIELRFVWSHSEQVGTLNLHWRFSSATGAADERALVLALLIGLHGTGTVEIRDREEHRPALCEQTTPTPVPDDLRFLHTVYDALATVQRFAGSTFGPPPEEITYEVAQQLAWLAQALRDGGYDAMLSNASMRCGPEALGSFRRSGSTIEVRETLCAEFFGRELTVANRSVQLPLMVIKQATRLPGSEPLWDVELVPAIGDQAEVRFVLAPLDQLAEPRAA